MIGADGRGCILGLTHTASQREMSISSISIVTPKARRTTAVELRPSDEGFVQASSGVGGLEQGGMGHQNPARVFQ
jgi:hypothetical protein